MQNHAGLKKTMCKKTRETCAAEGLMGGGGGGGGGVFFVKNISMKCTRFKTNYNIVHLFRSSENICRSSGGAQEKRKTGRN